MKIRLRRLNTEEYVEIMICLVFGFNLVMFTFNNIVRLIVGNTYYLDSIFVFACYAFVVIRALPQMINSIRIKDIVFLLLLFLLIIFTCHVEEVRNKIFSQLLPYGLLAFLSGISVRDCESTWTFMKRFSWAVIIMAAIDTYVIRAISDTSHMLGYVALFPACVLIVEVLNNRKNRLINVFGILFSSIMVIHSDTAGALASIALCAIVAMIYSIKNFKKWAFVLIVFFLSIILLVVTNLSLIISFLITILEPLNVNVSVLNEVLYSGITTDRFRDSIYLYCNQYIKEHIFWGSGIGNDRLLITCHTLVHDQSMVSNYPHNIFLELMFQFGAIIGILLSIYLVYKIVRYLFAEKDIFAQRMVTVFLGLGFFPLLYSSSYIENAAFFLLISFCWRRLLLIKTQRTLTQKV